MRPAPSPTMSPMRETDGSHRTAPSILPARRLVAITSIDWFMICDGLILVFSIMSPRNRCAQLPCGVAITLPSSHLIASSDDLNLGASARTITTLHRCPADNPVFATRLIGATLRLVVDTTAGI